MFTVSILIVGALIYFVLLACTLAYFAGATRAGDKRRHGIPVDMDAARPSTHNEHARHAA